MSWLWIALGWTGQAMFFSRFLVQWWHSERAGRSVAPISFWWLSLVGTVLVGGYTFQRGEAVLLPVFAINSAIYARNLLLAGESRGKLLIGPRIAALLGLAAAVALWLSGAFEPRADLRESHAWLVLGGVGTTIWSSRFLLQWWASERSGASHFPPSFWWTSLAGNALLLAYAIHLADPLYVAGFAIGPFVQVRNLMLIYRPKGELVPVARVDEGAPGADGSGAATTRATEQGRIDRDPAREPQSSPPA
ncbi:lipid-A-disaccharide synthase N-terminal domain-containing protein [Engelhardtia mirabilis]|uniref:Lipid-A-disaccharide synthase n=1 Tax=Engelhardtia mirabilis TaxID=2528011 RepID=A0A518BH37_9BACT|nr:lipid-A-disaccharide synthase [Planctomycetes bacterium Pla133]QDV00626.1 lipid-A-disaccharide synthase [Planctomycetes bacterium Pla86]